MRGAAELILGILVMVLAAVGVWEYTVIASLKKEVKSKELMIDAQAVRARDLQQQIVDKDRTIQLLTMPRKAAAAPDSVVGAMVGGVAR